MAAPLTADDWHRHWDQIVDLYLVQDWTLDEVRQFMNTTYGFNPSEKQYTTMFKKWHVKKNLLHEEKTNILMIDAHERAKGKTNRFTLWSLHISREDIEGLRRQREQELIAGKNRARQAAGTIIRCPKAMSGLKRSTVTPSKPCLSDMVADRVGVNECDPTLLDSAQQDRNLDEIDVGSFLHDRIAGLGQRQLHRHEIDRSMLDATDFKDPLLDLPLAREVQAMPVFVTSHTFDPMLMGVGALHQNSSH